MTCECLQGATASWCRASAGQHSCPQKGIKASVLHAGGRDLEHRDRQHLLC